MFSGNLHFYLFLLYKKLFISSYYNSAEKFCLKNEVFSAPESNTNTSIAVIRSGDAADRSCIDYNITDNSTQGICIVCPL